MNIRTTLLICQHEKCANILQGIHKATYFRDESQKSLNKGTYAPEYHKSQVSKYNAIRERLINSYSNALAKIVKPVIDKMEMA